MFSLLKKMNNERTLEIKLGKSRSGRLLLFPLFFLILTAFFSSCRSDRFELPEEKSFEGFIVQSSEEKNKKMIHCYGRLIRTLSREARDSINVDSCRNAALMEMDKKLAMHTRVMEILTRKCYSAILESPCDRFAEKAFWDPWCVKLRTETQKSYGASRETNVRAIR